VRAVREAIVRGSRIYDWYTGTFVWRREMKITLRMLRTVDAARRTWVAVNTNDVYRRKKHLYEFRTEN
jgi:hypothetical protein